MKKKKSVYDKLKSQGLSDEEIAESFMLPSDEEETEEQKIKWKEFLEERKNRVLDENTVKLLKELQERLIKEEKLKSK